MRKVRVVVSAVLVLFVALLVPVLSLADEIPPGTAGPDGEPGTEYQAEELPASENPADGAGADGEDSGRASAVEPVDIGPLVSVMEQVRDALVCLFVVVSYTGGAMLGCSMGGVLRGLMS